MTKVKQELRKKNTSELVDYSNNVVTNMTGNENFATPNPSLADVTAAATSVTTANNDVETLKAQLQNKQVILDQKIETLVSLMTSLGTYVDNISDGNEAIITSAGMDVVKDRTSATLPSKVTSLIASVSDNAGEISLKWDKDSMAKSYIIEIAEDATTLSWQTNMVSTKIRATIKDLTSAVKYHIRVAAVGSVGQGSWSDTVSKVVP